MSVPNFMAIHRVVHILKKKNNKKIVDLKVTFDEKSEVISTELPGTIHD